MNVTCTVWGSPVFLWGLLTGFFWFFGCSKPTPPQFQLDMMAMIENEIPVAQQQQISTVLEALFGTPNDPFVLPDVTGLDSKKLAVAAGSVWSDEGGQKFGLYREHCAHCHGIAGDGHGPTAAYLNPYPRDYTLGKFKYKSTERSAQPTTKDIRRILDNGIPGTAMASFRLLAEDERDALVEYVKYLSIRGQMETALVNYCVDELDENATLDTSRELLVEEMLSEIAQKWSEADDQVIHPGQKGAPAIDIIPAKRQISAAKGRDLFYGKRANCFSCHGETALGDGQTDDYDDWNKAVAQFEKTHEDINPESLGLLPPRTIKPRNLRDGTYRGGRRPLDLFWRIYSGINGTPMPATGPAVPGGKGVLTSEEIWHLVDYVLHLPYEPASMPPTLNLKAMEDRL